MLGSDRIIRHAIDYSKSTKDIADALGLKYNLTSEERRTTLKQLRLVRKSQQQFCGEICRKSRRDADQRELLDWLDEKIELVDSRHSESDDE